MKGPQIMKGYWKNPAADRDTFVEGGWMRTGDVCVFDEDRDMFIVDRVKEVGPFLPDVLCLCDGADDGCV